MRPQKLFRIARWEVTKGVGGVDRGAVAVVAAATVFVFAVGLVAVAGSVAIEDGIYRVGVAENSDFHEPVTADPSFAVVEPHPEATDAGRLVDDRYDLLLEQRGSQTRIYLARDDGEPTDKSLAALAALRRSTDQYNDRKMLAESNDTAATRPAVEPTAAEPQKTTAEPQKKTAEPALATAEPQKTTAVGSARRHSGRSTSSGRRRLRGRPLTSSRRFRSSRSCSRSCSCCR